MDWSNAKRPLLQDSSHQLDLPAIHANGNTMQMSPRSRDTSPRDQRMFSPGRHAMAHDTSSPSMRSFRQNPRHVRAAAKNFLTESQDFSRGRDHKGLTQSVKGLTVRHMVDSMIDKEKGGIEGYYVPKVVTYADKPTSYSIAKKSDKPRDFISLIQK